MLIRNIDQLRINDDGGYGENHVAKQQRHKKGKQNEGRVIGRKNVQHLQVMRQRDQNAGCERCHNENVLLVHPLR